MFDHLRAQLASRLAQALAALQDAETTAERAALAADEAATTVGAAAASLQNAEAVVAPAQAVVSAAQQAQAGARQTVAAAQDAIREWLDSEPETDIGTKPNPTHGRWARLGPPLKKRLAEAQAQVSAADADLANAENALGQATARAANARQQLLAAQAGQASALAQLGTVRATVVDRHQQAQAVSRLTVELDAEQAGILADPLDRGALQELADRQTAAALAARQARRSHRQELATVAAERAATLAQQDEIVNRLAPLCAEIRGQIRSVPYPELAIIADGLEQVVAESAVQRVRDVPDRTDDLTAAGAALATLAEHGARVLSAAQATLQQAREKLDSANSDLAALRTEWR
ncbi:hypothetical protein [Actinoplanes sp. NPDC049599]|uniref:hypothetical protein n=1 Tax=Actinoplanes sp. NPDC049599 TaxID=3363903 RepID=UPI00378D7D6F